jgi:hypothetical protein
MARQIPAVFLVGTCDGEPSLGCSGQGVEYPPPVMKTWSWDASVSWYRFRHNRPTRRAADGGDSGAFSTLPSQV